MATAFLVEGSAPTQSRGADRVQTVLSLARGTCPDSLSPPDIAKSISFVCDSKNSIASTMLLYPEGRCLLEGARKEQSSRLIAAELRKSVLEALADKELDPVATLHRLHATIGDDGLPGSWEMEAHDTQSLWSKAISLNVLDPWHGWSKDVGLEKVRDVKTACTSLLRMLALVPVEHAQKALLTQGVRCCELMESIDGGFDVKNADHLKSIESISAIYAE